MQYAIEILERDRLNIRHTIRKMKILSDECQHDFVGEEWPKREAELQQAIAHLQGGGTQPTIDNSGYTGEKPSPQMPSWEVAIKSVLFKTREERDVAAAIYENIARHFA